MYPLIRVDKRVPDGSIWQARRAYRLDDCDGWARMLAPNGTRWSNPLGGWSAQFDGFSLFHLAAFSGSSELLTFVMRCTGGGT